MMYLMENIIQLQDISFSYGRGKALDNITLGIANGVVGLMGPNGAGKTTLLKILMGFLNPSVGTGRVLGFDITRERKALRARIGYMPESDCLIPGLDAVSLTAYLGELSGMPRQEAIKRAHEVLYYVGLEEARYRMADTYSTGMKQRLKLAQALVHDPQLLLLDEPTSGMDPKGRKEMLELIKDIAQKESMNIIISSHLLPDVEYTCRQVVILNQGSLVAIHNVDGLSVERFHLYNLKLKGEITPFLDGLKALECAVEVNDRGMYRISIPAAESPRRIFELALKTRVQIRHFEPCRTTLEDTFVTAIGADNGH